MHLGRSDKATPCNCVLRSIFRACLARFRHCATKERYMTKISLELRPGRERSFTWGRKDEEYLADFILVARRSLTEVEYKLFTYHFLLGADWRLCCRRLSIDRGAFFHSVYRIEQALGRVFRELEPYALFPLDEYFHGPTRMMALADVRPSEVIPIARPRKPVEVPVRLRMTA
jgi:hypothetical protein